MYQAGAGSQAGVGVANPTSQCAPLDQKLAQWSTLAGRIFFLSRRKKFVRSLHGVKTEVVRTLLRILCVQPSVITPYELFPPKQKKNPTSQCAPLDQFLVQWSTLVLSDLPRFELAKRWKMGFLATPPMFI